MKQSLILKMIDVIVSVNTEMLTKVIQFVMKKVFGNYTKQYVEVNIKKVENSNNVPQKTNIKRSATTKTTASDSIFSFL